MNERHVALVPEPTVAEEAKGVTIHRSIGSDRLILLDPFLLLDHASIPAGHKEVVGFHRHPHRGIETLSWVVRGRVQHKDSLGNVGEVGPEGSQWMTAGNGIWHEEMLIPEEDGTEMVQLWFSMPRSQKRNPPAYVGAASGTIPTATVAGTTVTVVSGEFEGTRGIFEGIAVAPTILAVQFEPHATLKLPTEPGAHSFVYVTHGEVSVGQKSIPEKRLGILSDGDSVTIQSSGASRILFASAQPLNEPVFLYRSLVMNEPEDIEETYAMMDAGTFGS